MHPTTPHTGRPVAAFFDLDKTVIARSSVFAFHRNFLDEGMMTPRSLVRLIAVQLSLAVSGADDEQMARAREALATATKGWSPEQIASIAAAALTEAIRPHVYAEAAELIAEHHARGHDVVLVSASAQEIVAPIAGMLGVDHFTGTRTRLGEDGRFAGEIEFYCQGPGKVDAIRELARTRGYDLDRCHAYSDSATDIPMLSEVGHPTAVNPDRALRRYALEHGWPILTFSNPLPPADRLGVTPTGAAVGLGSVVVAAGAAAAIAYGIRHSH